MVVWAKIRNVAFLSLGSSGDCLVMRDGVDSCIGKGGTAIVLSWGGSRLHGCYRS